MKKTKEAGNWKREARERVRMQEGDRPLRKGKTKGKYGPTAMGVRVAIEGDALYTRADIRRFAAAETALDAYEAIGSIAGRLMREAQHMMLIRDKIAYEVLEAGRREKTP